MKSPELGPAIFEDGDFSLHLAPWPNPLWEGQTGYMMVNNRYGTIEGVFGTEAMGIMECRTAVRELRNALDNAVQLASSDDQAFQEMMHRLHNKDN